MQRLFGIECLWQLLKVRGSQDHANAQVLSLIESHFSCLSCILMLSKEICFLHKGSPCSRAHMECLVGSLGHEYQRLVPQQGVEMECQAHIRQMPRERCTLQEATATWQRYSQVRRSKDVGCHFAKVDTEPSQPYRVALKEQFLQCVTIQSCKKFQITALLTTGSNILWT